jgi:predicted RNA-binding Zn ribbon-like protein
VATEIDIHNLPQVAGHPALDLVNTVEPRLPPADRLVASGEVKEHLLAPSDLLVWAGRAGILTEPEIVATSEVWRANPDLARHCLSEVVAGREALYSVLRSVLDGEPIPGADPRLALLSDNRAVAAARTRLVPGESLRFEELVGTEPGLVVFDRLAVAAVDLLRSAELSLLRACPLEEGGCGWLFLDRSRGHTRRWCVMADCGTKAKARRLNDRRRVARARR